MVFDALAEMGTNTGMFNQRQFVNTHLPFSLVHDRLSGILGTEGQQYNLEKIEGVYMRLVDDEALPEVLSLPADSPQRHHCQCLHDTLLRWHEITLARVVNRLRPMGRIHQTPEVLLVVPLKQF